MLFEITTFEAVIDVWRKTGYQDNPPLQAYHCQNNPPLQAFPIEKMFNIAVQFDSTFGDPKFKNWAMDHTQYWILRTVLFHELQECCFAVRVFPILHLWSNKLKANYM